MVYLIAAIALVLLGFLVGMSRIGRAIRHVIGILHDEDYEEYNYEDDD